MSEYRKECIWVCSQTHRRWSMPNWPLAIVFSTTHWTIRDVNFTVTVVPCHLRVSESSYLSAHSAATMATTLSTGVQNLLMMSDWKTYVRRLTISRVGNKMRDTTIAHGSHWYKIQRTGIDKTQFMAVFTAVYFQTISRDFHVKDHIRCLFWDNFCVLECLILSKN